MPTQIFMYLHSFFPIICVTTKISLEIGKILTQNTHKCNSSIVVCMLISLENWEITITKHPYYICTHLLTDSGAGAKSCDGVIYCKEKMHTPIHGKLLRTLIIGQSLTYMVLICSITLLQILLRRGHQIDFSSQLKSAKIEFLHL